MSSIHAHGLLCAVCLSILLALGCSSLPTTQGVRAEPQIVIPQNVDQVYIAPPGVAAQLMIRRDGSAQYMGGWGYEFDAPKGTFDFAIAYRLFVGSDYDGSKFDSYRLWATRTDDATACGANCTRDRATVQALFEKALTAAKAPAEALEKMRKDLILPPPGGPYTSLTIRAGGWELYVHESGSGWAASGRDGLSLEFPKGTFDFGQLVERLYLNLPQTGATDRAYTISVAGSREVPDRHTRDRALVQEQFEKGIAAAPDWCFNGLARSDVLGRLHGALELPPPVTGPATAATR